MKMMMKRTTAAAAAAMMMGMMSSPGSNQIINYEEANSCYHTYNLHWTVVDTLTWDTESVTIEVSEAELATAHHGLELLEGGRLGAGVQLVVCHEVEADLDAAGPRPQVLDLGHVRVEDVGQLVPQIILECIFIG